MGTKTIGVREDVYERLKARKREGESFTDLLDRLIDESSPEWREHFGTLSPSEGDELEELVADSRNRVGDGLATRQERTLEELDEMDR